MALRKGTVRRAPDGWAVLTRDEESERPSGAMRQFAARAASDEPVPVHMAVSHAARERLLVRLNDGDDEFLLTSRDGTFSTPARLSITIDDAVEAAAPASQVAIDWARAIIMNGTNRLALSRTEVRLLAALVQANGDAVSKVDLVAAIWPEWDGPARRREQALTVYVASLRKRLAAVGLPDALETVSGGYCVRF
jgi:DNA-binding response OmpR family regulator